MKEFAMFVVALLAPGLAWGQDVGMVVDNQGCVRFTNAPAFTKVKFFTKGTKGGWATRNATGCYRPKWQNGKATVAFQLFQGNKPLMGIMEKEIVATSTVTTVIQQSNTVTASNAPPTTVSVEDELKQCRLDLESLRGKLTNTKAALDDCLKVRVKSKISWPWRTKKWCDTKGKKLGMVWKKAKNKFGGYCDCPGGKKDWNKRKGRCITSGAKTPGAAAVATTPVNLDNIIPRLTALEKVVAEHGKRLDDHDKEIAELKKQGPGMDKIARDKADAADKKADEALKIAQAIRDRPVQPGQAATVFGKSWFGMSLQVRGDLVAGSEGVFGHMSLLVEPTFRFEVEGYWIEVNGGIGIATNFTAGGGLSFVGEGAVVVFPWRSIGIGVLYEYSAYDINKATYAARRGQLHAGGVRIVIRPWERHSFVVDLLAGSRTIREGTSSDPVFVGHLGYRFTFF